MKELTQGMTLSPRLYVKPLMTAIAAIYCLRLDFCVPQNAKTRVTLAYMGKKQPDKATDKQT